MDLEFILYFLEALVVTIGVMFIAVIGMVGATVAGAASSLSQDGMSKK